MPTRQQTRAESRAAYIATERRLNHNERAVEAPSAVPSQTDEIRPPDDPDDPPPF